MKLTNWKRLACFTAALLLLFTMAPFAQAAENEISREIIYYEDGSWLEITVVQSLARAANTTTGFTRMVFNDADGTTAWRAILSGDYTYDGTTATCTNATCDVYIYDNDFYAASSSAAKNGPTATGTFTIARRFLGITVARDTYTMTLTCSPDGDLS